MKIIENICTQTTFIAPLPLALLTVLLVLAGDLIMFLPVSADSWISQGQSVHCVVSTKELQVIGLVILSLSHPSFLSLIGTVVMRRSISLT